MAKTKKGPRQPIGLQCTVCKAFGYVSSYNKNNELLKKQTSGENTFPKENSSSFDEKTQVINCSNCGLVVLFIKDF
jgi:hypothetical protein